MHTAPEVSGPAASQVPGTGDPLVWHGGALDAAAARFGAPAQGWLDLSTGIAPYPYPIGRIPARAWQALPEQADERAFLAACRRTHGVPADAGLIAVPGIQAALLRLPPVLCPDGGTVAVPDPGYRGHREAWEMAGHACVVLDDPLSVLTEDPGPRVAVVINPNNPDGRTWAPEILLAAADRQAARGGWLVVDEAFAEVRPDLSLLSHAGRSGLIILRSFGKFFGLAGVRLGWLAGPADPIAALARRMGPWSVSGPALAIGARAEADRPWHEAQRRRLSAQAARLDGVLDKGGLSVVGGTCLFRLVQRRDGGPAAPLFERLGRAGILVRPFSDRPARLRIGLPRTREDLRRLARAL